MEGQTSRSEVSELNPGATALLSCPWSANSGPVSGPSQLWAVPRVGWWGLTSLLAFQLLREKYVNEICEHMPHKKDNVKAPN